MGDSHGRLNSRKRRIHEVNASDVNDLRFGFSGDDNMSPDEETFICLNVTDNRSDSVGQIDNNEVLYPLVPIDLRTPFRTPYGKIPRLLKNDLRRFYPTMLTNMLNYHDRNFSREYFTKFYLSDSKLQLLQDLASCWSVISPEPSGHSKELVFGRGNIMAYYNSLFRSYPDFCATLQNVEIVRSNYSRSSTIHFRLLLKWTEVTSSMSAHKEPRVGNTENNEVAKKTIHGEISSNVHASEIRSSSAHLREEHIQHELLAAASLFLNEQWYVTDITGITIASNVKRLSINE